LAYFIEEYQRETGRTEVDMHAVAQYAMSRGLRAPKVPSDVELLAREFSAAAREQTRVDDKTGRPYRSYHVYRQRQGDRQLFLWVDIDKAPRTKMDKSLQMRRAQMIGDAVAITDDAEHWSRMHPHEKPIQIVLDFSDDVAERRITDDLDDVG
jgi:hypothetical protein